MLKSSRLSSLAESSSVKFGTSGLRGLVSEMTPELCFAYTSAFIQSIAKDATEVVIGHDLRPSSPAIAAACISAIEYSGKTPVYCGVLPTPALAYFALSISAPAIVITGSHIPFDRNGIKFYRAQGEITKDDELAMQSAHVDVPEPIALSALPAVDDRARQAYLKRYTEFFGENALAGSRVLFYEHSSAARGILNQVLTELGCEVISVGRTDEFVPIDTEAVRIEDIEQAKRWASEYEFDGIFSTDGDADRPLLGDEKGEWFRGDVVGVLCAHFLGAESVVAPVSCNSVLELSQYFKQTQRTRIGSPYVIEGMQSLARAKGSGVVVGYEANGGFLLGSEIHQQGSTLQPLPTRDAILPMLSLLVLARKQKCALSALRDQLPARYTYSNRLQNIDPDVSKKLLVELEGFEYLLRKVVPLEDSVERMDKTDGLRLYFSNGEIVHFRPSGSAPELRCYCESESEQRSEYLCESSLQRLASLV